MSKVVCYNSFFPQPERPKKEYSRFRKVFKVVYEANGNKRFEEVGATDMFALAQSHKDACSIENIIKRATNDPSVLNRTAGQYMDLTELPTNMQQCFEVINNAKEVFANLPQDQRATYNNSFSTFLGEFKTANGLAKFVSGLAKQKVAPGQNKVESEVTPDA